MSEMLNPFATIEGARRYRDGRPFHHRRAVARIIPMMDNSRVQRGLDVACGTGLSSVALADIAESVAGIDSVEAMVRLGTPCPSVRYAVADAEALPFPLDSFDAMTVSSGIHWFNQHRFFSEAARVLRPNSWMAIYDHFFVGPIDQPDMAAWLHNCYGERYPPPPRGSRADAPLDIPKHFTEIGVLGYEDPIAFTHRELVAYLLSHSNTIVASATGRETEQETASWLRTETDRWFEDRHPRRAFMFRGVLRCLTLTG